MRRSDLRSYFFIFREHLSLKLSGDSRYSFSINAWNMNAIPARNNPKPKMTAGICNISGVLKSLGYIPRAARHPAKGNAMMHPPVKNRNLFFQVPRFSMNVIAQCLVICFSSYNYFSDLDSGY